ncbi:MAG TPA: hypothetical protein VKZ65_02460 [Glycomyces sp.]|nr:hypothetical protein [Glycomyces sp.]
MDVFMEVERVRGGGTKLTTIAPRARRASDRVREPADHALAGNEGFFTGEAGLRWRSALETVTEGVERRLDWQGRQVAASADDMDGCDREVGGRLTDIEREMPRGRRV